MMRLLGVVIALFMFFSADAAYAACTSPAGAAGKIVYNQAAKTFQYCNNTNWIEMNTKVGAGTGGCTSPTAPEGRMIYNADARVLQGCAGNVYRAMGPVGGGVKWRQVSSGESLTCGIKNNGTLWCWGSDASGQLGNGATTGDQLSPVQESTAATNWANVSVGFAHTCAVKTTGTVWCWGDDSYGQIGNGATTGTRVSPTQESTAATDWANVSAGYGHTCAVKTTGTLWCWGWDGSGQIGNGATTGNRVSPTQESTAATDWANVSTGGVFTCAVKTTGTLWCWGGDGNGKLGNGAPTADQVSPMQESTAATNWRSVSVDNSFACAVKTTGTLWCWGSDGNGKLGNGAPTADQVSPMQESTAATNWATVSTYSDHTCAVKTTGTLWCWGSDSFGQIGNGATTGDRVSPTQESTAATDWANVSAGDAHTCAVKTTGTLWCWGDGDNGKLGNGATTGEQASPVRESTIASNWADVSAGSTHTCAVKTDGTLWCWGNDFYGQIGNGATTGNQVSPVQESTSASNWATVGVGYSHTCAVKTTGTLWCWGNDSVGQLGNGGTTGIQISPVQESTSATNWASVSAGFLHTCAVKTNGTVWCWGWDNYGQIGNGATTGDRVSPTQESTAASNWANVSAGENHNCGLKVDGTLWCWGIDTYGQIGNGATTGDQVSPVQETTVANDWTSVSAGDSHTCAIKTTGTLWCWGSDSSGQIGNGATAVDQVSPVQESTSASNWTSVSGGEFHTCGLKANNTLWCWGDDGFGQLGNGPTSGNQVNPVQINIGYTTVDSGMNSTCAITSGKLSCWGNNDNGQLGAGIGMGDSPVASNICSLIGGQKKGPGSILFNSTTNVLQYCDGAGWVKAGK